MSFLDTELTLLHINVDVFLLQNVLDIHETTEQS